MDLSASIIDSQCPPPIPNESQALPARAIGLPPCVHIASEKIVRQFSRCDSVFPDSYTKGYRIFVWHLNIPAHDVGEALATRTGVIGVGMLSHREVPKCILLNRDERSNSGVLDPCSAHHLPIAN